MQDVAVRESVFLGGAGRVCVRASGLINIQRTPTEAREGRRGIQGCRDRAEGLQSVDRWTGSNRDLIVRGLIRQAGVQLGTRLTPAAQHTP